ncbi:MAG: hypothetical protein JXD18_03470, partial [Anaerolineae bacterium]|nr:hypothetical protein [Anaerolineae bacterium]
MGDVGPHCLVARSISRPVPDRLPAARVLAVFERACDLVTEAGDVIALVTPDVGDGPLNIVVEGQPGCFAGVETGTIATVDNGTLWVGNSLSVSLKHAAIWEPRPDWERFRAQYRAMV